MIKLNFSLYFLLGPLLEVLVFATSRIAFRVLKKFEERTVFIHKKIIYLRSELLLCPKFAPSFLVNFKKFAFIFLLR